MTFSFEQAPIVKDRIREVFAQMHISPDDYMMLYTFLVFSFLPTQRVVEDSAKPIARIQDNTRLNTDISNRIDNIVRAMREMQTYAGPVATVSEPALAALALRDTYDQGVQGFAMLSKYPEASAFVNETRAIYAEFERVHKETTPSHDTWKRLGPAAQLIVQVHAADVARRTLLKLTDEQSRPTLVERQAMMAAVNRYRPLMAAIGEGAAVRYKSIVSIIDATLLTPQTMPTTKEKPSAQIIPVSFGGRPSAFVKN